MTTKIPAWRRFLAAWAITSAIIPFLIFAILSIFELSFTNRIIITCGGILAWLFILLPFYVMDWDERRRERLRMISRSDAILKLRETIIDVNDDGSSTVRRHIIGVNLADEREFYELISWTDPERNKVYEESLLEQHKMLATVSATKSGKHRIVCKNKKFLPIKAHRVNRVVHIIPVTKNAPLKCNDIFEIDFSEKTLKNTWKISGDWYQNRIRHVIEKLRIVMVLPENWRFPKDIPATEKFVVGELKRPTCGKWEKTSEKPDLSRSKGRYKITWEINNPALLNIYRLTYHRMIRE